MIPCSFLMFFSVISVMDKTVKQVAIPFVLMYNFQGIQVASKCVRISSYIQWSSLFWEGCPYLFFFSTSSLHLSSLFIIFVSHLMTWCRWSHDSWITSCPLITVYVNKPVSYANLNHGWLGETITTDEQQEEDRLDTCFSVQTCLSNLHTNIM